MNRFNFSMLILLTLIVCFTLQGKTKVSIRQAFEKRYISAKAICNGGLELNYTVSNLLNDSLVVVIPPGWRFNSDAGKNDYQDILVTKQELLVLKANEKKRFLIRGFCCEATKSGPVSGAPYTLGTLADTSLTLLARYLYQHPIDENTQQNAVWAISDKEETANITAPNDSLASLLRNFVATVKGEPLPWYTLLKRANVTSFGTVNNHPVRFKADINYSVGETTYSYCYIIDSKGNVVSEIFGKWLLPQNNDYHANFSVAGLKKGEYTLVLNNKKATLFEKTFKI